MVTTAARKRATALLCVPVMVQRAMLRHTSRNVKEKRLNKELLHHILGMIHRAFHTLRKEIESYDLFCKKMVIAMTCFLKSGHPVVVDFSGCLSHIGLKVN